MYWYAGFPMYRFYMVVPALMIVGLNALWIPYGVAFKIVAVLGLVTLPFCCWAFGRLARFRYPIPELFALAGLLFLFDESFSIYGGNVKSTMAGEFSFSIALSLRDARPRPVRPRPAERQVPQLGGDRARPGDRRRHGVVAIFVVARRRCCCGSSTWTRPASSTGSACSPATALLSAFWVGAVPVQPPVHDRHEVRVPAGRADRLVLEDVLPVPAVRDIVVNGLAIIGFALRHRAPPAGRASWLGMTVPRADGARRTSPAAACR